MQPPIRRGQHLSPSHSPRVGRPVVGLAFNSIGRFAQGGILRDRMIPRLLEADPEALLGDDGLDPEAIRDVAMQDEKPGGHGDRAGAVAALELAAWDLNAKLADEPTYATIARRHGTAANDSVSVYAAGGYYYPCDADGDGSARQLREELKRHRDMGFDQFKIKVGGASVADDLRRIEQTIDVVGTGSQVAVDAHGRFGFVEAVSLLGAIEPYGLRWFEEPGDPLDYALNAEVTARYPGSVATGENLFSVVDVANLARYGGMRPGLDIFQMDPGLSYGLTEYVEQIALLENAGFDRSQCHPHGGHVINLHLVAGLGLGGCEAYPGVFQPVGGFPPVCSVENGRISPPPAPGFGLELNPGLSGYLEGLCA
ncbi:MAG: mandelate racemase [Actinomycetia bacterium]|nr:mandelate racemase [Actinomycetes bacterium]